MSEGLARASGGGTTLEVDGKTYIIGALTLDDFGLIENHMLGMRQNALDAVLPHLSKLNEADRQFMLKEALADLKKHKDANKIPVKEVQEWMGNIGS